MKTPGNLALLNLAYHSCLPGVTTWHLYTIRKGLPYHYNFRACLIQYRAPLTRALFPQPHETLSIYSHTFLTLFFMEGR